MIDFVDKFYYDTPIKSSEGYDKERARQKAFQAIIPLILSNELTEKQSVCIRYRYLSGMNQQEIAEKLRLSQPTVSRHITTGKDVINTSLKYCYIALNKALDEYDRLNNMC